MNRRLLSLAIVLTVTLAAMGLCASFPPQITVKVVERPASAAGNGNRAAFTPRLSVRIIEKSATAPQVVEKPPPAAAATEVPPAGPGRVTPIATHQITDTATTAFVWNYAHLMNNWNSATGLVRDESLDASGDHDATKTTGSLAAATAIAAQLGVISHEEAVKIVNRISQTLLEETPRYHGLLPHFVQTSANGAITIVPQTEWSSIDSVIAGLSLLTAQGSLGLDTSRTEDLLREIDWADLTEPDGMISMGYTDTGERIPWVWDTFGGESWLVELAYAAATGQVAPLTYASPPTANGSGFIDELAWLFVPPPTQPDRWGTDWTTYRLEAADRQIRYYHDNFPGSCFDQLGLFGLSAAEDPGSLRAPVDRNDRSFGVGGRAPANDGSILLGAPVVVPHYSAMIASLRPQEAITMWKWLIEHGIVSPWNNVESLMFPSGSPCTSDPLMWNDRKGLWNVALQTLGWGRYLAEREGQAPALWEATMANQFLQRGYGILVADDLTLTESSASTPAEIPAASPMLWSQLQECEDLDESTVGQTIERPDASGGKVHGQFGTQPAWPPQPGYVRYTGIALPQTDTLYLRLRYSKFSPPSTPIVIFLDDETTPRASIVPVDQGSWETFAWTAPILLGSVAEGVHAIKFATEGQEFGVADLDSFTLSDGP